MATLNYQNRLRNLENRKFDNSFNESAASSTYRSTAAPENIRYLLESMTQIDTKYNNRTIEAAQKVQNHLENSLNVHFNRAYRTQGSVITKTNIKVHSDFDLLAIVDRYVYPQTSNGNEWTASVPDDDIREFRKQATTILKNIYDEVDTTNEKCISIFNKSLNRKVDVVFAFWYNSDKYEAEKNEYYRGIYLYRFHSSQKQLDYPFAHMHQVNAKGEETTDGSRRAIRLLKTLKADCETDLSDLKSFQLTALIHSIDSARLRYQLGNDLSIATETSMQVTNVLEDGTYRKSIKSPNGIENPLASDSVVPLLKRLKIDIDELIVDANREMRSPIVRQAVQAYHIK
jgi:hypothetical protein